MKKVWRQDKYNKKNWFGIHGLRCFSSMFPSMPMWEIVSNEWWWYSFGGVSYVVREIDWHVAFMTMFFIDVDIALFLYRMRDWQIEIKLV